MIFYIYNYCTFTLIFSGEEHSALLEIPDQDLGLWPVAGGGGPELLPLADWRPLARQMVRPRVHQLRHLHPRQRRLELRRRPLGDV